MKRQTVFRPIFNSQFSILNLKQGWYVSEATAKDQYGQEVKDVKYFQVFDAKSSTLPVPAYVWSYVEKNSLQPGETAHVITGTSAKDVFLIEEINKEKMAENDRFDGQNESITLNYFKLNNKKTFDFPISENDRGGFGVNQFYVKDNRFYVTSSNIYVPWSNKELNISFDTYRDKTLPGSEEKWKVKITGNKGEKLAAEMLASMYDASLDQFKPHSWNNLSSIWPNYSSTINGRQDKILSPVNSFEKYWSEKYIEQKEKRYDALNYLPNFNTHIVLRGADVNDK